MSSAGIGANEKDRDSSTNHPALTLSEGVR
jgi:hypothetical protein